MLIAGKTLQFGDTLTMSQKRYLVQRVGSLARQLQSRGYKVRLTPSVRTDSVYLVVGAVEISFRNHVGGPHDYNVFLSSFPTWKEAKKHVLSNIIPRLPAPHQSITESDIVDDEKVDVGRPFPMLDESHFEPLEELQKNIHALHRFVTPAARKSMNDEQLDELKKTIALAHSNYDKYRNKVKNLMPIS